MVTINEKAKVDCRCLTGHELQPPVVQLYLWVKRARSSGLSFNADFKYIKDTLGTVMLALDLNCALQNCPIRPALWTRSDCPQTDS